ncbi:MAG: hypothetical protein GF334_03645 [Candidatus Altiarchaeales archaeon]|nr:hypothetical protein [Candidatus Altiarchaeales archaeon]
MLTALIVIISVVLVAAGFLLWELKKLSSQKEEYKQLFELGDSEYKKAQERIQSLQEKVGQKDVLMDRASQMMEVANRKIIELEGVVKALDEKLKFQESQYSKLAGQKKSSEVRTGRIAEQVAPFLKDYPKDPNSARFIGEPIDFIHFDDDLITFVEVKSGKSQLSKRQRRFRDLIKEGKVDFILYRIDGADNGSD